MTAVREQHRDNLIAAEPYNTDEYNDSVTAYYAKNITNPLMVPVLMIGVPVISAYEDAKRWVDEVITNFGSPPKDSA